MLISNWVFQSILYRQNPVLNTLHEAGPATAPAQPPTLAAPPPLQPPPLQAPPMLAQSMQPAVPVSRTRWSFKTFLLVTLWSDSLQRVLMKYFTLKISNNGNLCKTLIGYNRDLDTKTWKAQHLDEVVIICYQKIAPHWRLNLWNSTSIMI